MMFFYSIQNVSEVNRERSRLGAASIVCDSTKHNGLITEGCHSKIHVIEMLDKQLSHFIKVVATKISLCLGAVHKLYSARALWRGRGKKIWAK